MNMKKTIAAIAAGAMAVSAMAVTVSADTTLTYNLTAAKHVEGSASTTLQATITDGTADTLKKIELTDPADRLTPQTITLRITDESDSSVNKTYVYSSSKDALNYNAKFTGDTFEFGNELYGLNKPKVQVTIVCGTTYADLTTLNGVLNVDKGVAVKDASGSASAKVTPTIAVAFTGKTDTVYKVPLKTGPGKNENVAYWLQNNNCRDDNNPYRNVLPTINDALANFDSATFVFTTASQPVAWAVDGNFGAKKKTYNEAVVAANGDESRITGFYDADGDKSYTSFTQHVYAGTSDFYGAGAGWLGYDGEPLGIAWAGQNLFGGALVINENLTMTLSDVDYFQWTATTLSFDWEAIMDGAMTSNAYATYVQSIKLATSVNWYWDKMDVVLIEGESDDASADAGTESEEETLDETDTDETADEEITDEETEDEAPADEEEEAPADEAEETPVQDNPGTGNAPVALAVIPVALAAAAVVAKKRG